jgi:hypothetical protein
MYEEKVNLNGSKDPSTDLWTLPITPDTINWNVGAKTTTECKNYTVQLAAPQLTSAQKPPTFREKA